MGALLEKVKQNLILDHAADDALLKGYTYFNKLVGWQENGVPQSSYAI